MLASEAEVFGKALIEEVRDDAIRNCDLLVRPDSVDATEKRWRSTGADLESTANVMIPDVVDQVIFCLLDAIDNGRLKLAYTAPGAAETVDLEGVGAGEMAGEFIRTEGWRARYAKVRYFDDFGDLKLE